MGLSHSDKIIHDFAYPRLHLQNKGLHIYYPSDTSMLRGINGWFTNNIQKKWTSSKRRKHFIIFTNNNDDSHFDLKISNKLSEYYIKINNSKPSKVNDHKVTFYKINDIDSYVAIFTVDDLIYELKTEDMKVKELKKIVSLLLNDLKR